MLKPYQKNINKDTIQRLFEVLNSELILAFYKKKHDLMQYDLAQSNVTSKFVTLKVSESIL